MVTPTGNRHDRTLPGWVDHPIIWHIYPLGFVGAPLVQAGNSAVVPRLQHISAWLDYAVDLGVSVIQLGPVFSSGTHGYDTVDYFRIDPRLGDRGDFDELIRQAHRRGLKVVLDGVFNHVGADHPLFRAALAGDHAAAQLFRISSIGDRDEPSAYETFEGHAALPALDHDNPAVAELVEGVMDHWLDLGADGWRLDAAYAVPPEFWARVLPSVRGKHPQAFIFGEVIHGDYAGIVAATAMDSVTQYELWKAVWSSINDRNFFELMWAMKRHNDFLGTFTPVTFVGNHDVTRLATVLGDRRHLAHALVVLFTTGGLPVVYYGDEQAFEGVKEDGPRGDDAVRPAFPSRPDELDPAGWPTYRLHQDLIGLRRRHPWLRRARTEQLILTNRQVVYRVSSESEFLIVALNLDDSPLEYEYGPPLRLLAGSDPAARGSVGVHITVSPHGWAVLGPPR